MTNGVTHRLTFIVCLSRVQNLADKLIEAYKGLRTLLHIGQHRCHSYYVIAIQILHIQLTKWHPRALYGKTDCTVPNSDTVDTVNAFINSYSAASMVFHYHVAKERHGRVVADYVEEHYTFLVNIGSDWEL